MTLSSILVPSSGCLIGIYPSSSCDSDPSYLNRVRNHETLINRTATTGGILNITSAYHDWNDYATRFPTSDEQTLSGEGRLLLIHWTPRVFGTATQYNWADIAAGTYDTSIVIPQARLMRDWGETFFLAFHNEMNASSTAQGGTYGTDANYAAAAQHVHDVFVAQGATNVVWVFKPSGFTDTISRMSTLYPGDAYVDWIGFDPYGNASLSDTADSVLSTKYPMVNWATVTKSGSHTKPMMLAEWGKREVSGNAGAKAQFFTDLGALLKNPPNTIIKAIVYFNGVAGSSECLNTSTTTLNGYKALAADQFFNPDVSPTGPPVAQGAFAASAVKAFSNSANQTITIPAGVQAGMGMTLLWGATRTGLKNAAEGTNLANVTTGNSNSVGSNPWNSIGATIPVYSSTQAHSGTTSIHYSLAAGTTVRTTWTSASFGSTSSYYGRLYYYRTALPPQITRLYQQNGAAGTPLQWGIGLDTAGKVIVRDIPAGATRYTSTITPAANVWNRIEWQVVWNGSTSTVNVRIYENTGASETTLDDSGSSTAFTQAAAGGEYNFGMQSPSQTYDIYLDDMGLDVNAWMGPAGTSAALTGPAGWTEVVPSGTQAVAAGAGELSTKAYRRTAAAGDPGSNVALNTDVNCHGAIVLLAYSGVDQLALVDVAAASTKSADSATVVTPNVTTNNNNEWIVSFAFVRDNPGGLTGSWTLPGGEAQRAAAFPSGTPDGRVAVVASDDGVGHATGTYGTKTFTASATSYLGVGWTVAIMSTTAVSSGQGLGFMSQHN